VNIAIMGCIVNVPGEMADADFGYVGDAPGKVNLYAARPPLSSIFQKRKRWIDYRI
jgi:(E)-4-hydroxy-3-methylbut-2-enyl-diphosphate synthase